MKKANGEREVKQYVFFLKKCLRTSQIRQMKNWLNMFRPFGRIIPLFLRKFRIIPCFYMIRIRFFGLGELTQRDFRAARYLTESTWTPKIQIKYVDTKNQLADILTISHVMNDVSGKSIGIGQHLSQTYLWVLLGYLWCAIAPNRTHTTCGACKHRLRNRRLTYRQVNQSSLHAKSEQHASQETTTRVSNSSISAENHDFSG